MTNTAEEIKPLIELMHRASGNYRDVELKQALAKEILKHYLPSPSVVSPLQWVENDVVNPGVTILEATTLAAAYFIEKKKGDFVLYIEFGEGVEMTFETLNEAKQAAQSHFNTLIGSCLQGGGATHVIPIINKLDYLFLLFKSAKPEDGEIIEDLYKGFIELESALKSYLYSVKQNQGGYMEEQMKDLIQYMYKRITKTTLAPFNIEDYFNDYLSSLKQQ